MLHPISRHAVGSLATLTLLATLHQTVPARALSDPFIVNTPTADSRYLAFAVASGNGDIGIGWRNGQSTTLLQRYSGDGSKVYSDDWYVTNSDWQDVKASFDRSGNMAVVASVVDGNGKAVYAKVVGRDGSVKVQPFKVNTTLSASVSQPVIAMNDNGQIAIAWTANSSGGLHALYARTFNANGTPVAGEITIKPNSTVWPLAQDIAIDGAGNFSPVWQGDSPTDVNIARLTINGNFLSPPGIANTTTQDSQAGGKIAMNGQGQAVVVWESRNQDGSGLGMYGQRFDKSGAKVGTEFRINESTIGDQSFGDVGIAQDGSFVVSWVDDNRYNVPSAPVGVYLRQFRADGTPVGAPETVLQPTTPAPWFTRIATDPAGYFMVSWSANGSIYARRYVMDTTPTVNAVVKAVPVSGINGGAASWRYFKIVVPNGATAVTARITGGAAGDADLYVRLGALPTLSAYDGISDLAGNTEGVRITGIPPGSWYVGVYAYAPYSNVSLTVTYD